MLSFFENILSGLKKNKKVQQLSEEQRRSICNYIEKLYGKKPRIFHKVEFSETYIDILLISPTEKRSYYTLITLGMSAFKMNIPLKYNGQRLERCELIINLPANWDINSKNETEYWPIRELKDTANMPIKNDSWLGLGHTIAKENFQPFASNTKLCGFSLASSPINNFWFREMEKVNFYTLVPLYKEELEYTYKYGYPKLLDVFQLNNMPYPPVVDINRKNFCVNKE